MKKFKKIASLLLALVMVCAMGVTTLAASNTVSVANTTDHTYTAYQIFTGTQQDSTGTALGNIEWASTFDSAGFLADLQADETISSYFTDCETAEDVAAVLAEQASNSTLLDAFAALAYSYVSKSAAITITSGTTQLAAGYYLIIDTTEELEEGDTYSKAILLVTGSDTLTIQDKRVEGPEVEKTVNEAEAASAAIGDTLNYTLTGSIPDMSNYSTYFYQFVDTLSAGLTYNNDAKVYAVDANGEKTDITSSVTVNYNSETMVLTVTINDLKAYSEYESIVVEYTATLNENAVIGGNGTPNSVKLIYSNDPNSNGTGKTVEDKVTVVTFELNVDKVDESDVALSGAGFTLYKLADDGKTWVAVGEEITDVTTFEWEGLDVGTYKIVETTTPDGYNTAADIEFTITATYDENGVQTLTVSNENLTATASTGVIDTDVVNVKGSTLPSTGGMGTTIFYVVGTIMVLGAVVVLITRKRMSTE